MPSLALVATGLPDRAARRRSRSAREASFSYWFGTVRFVHFVAAFVFFFNFVGRIYWGFVGNQYARLGQLHAADAGLLRQQCEEVVEVLKVDILQAKVQPMESIGHNALAGWTYFLSFLAFLFQCADRLRHVRRDERRRAARSCSPGSCR